jgi:hypothetical protein
MVNNLPKMDSPVDFVDRLWDRISHYASQPVVKTKSRITSLFGPLFDLYVKVGARSFVFTALKFFIVVTLTHTFWPLFFGLNVACKVFDFLKWSLYYLRFLFFSMLISASIAVNYLFLFHTEQERMAILKGGASVVSKHYDLGEALKRARAQGVDVNATEYYREWLSLSPYHLNPHYYMMVTWFGAMTFYFFGVAKSLHLFWCYAKEQSAALPYLAEVRHIDLSNCEVEFEAIPGKPNLFRKVYRVGDIIVMLPGTVNISPTSTALKGYVGEAHVPGSDTILVNSYPNFQCMVLDSNGIKRGEAFRFGDYIISMGHVFKDHLSSMENLMFATSKGKMRITKEVFKIVDIRNSKGWDFAIFLPKPYVFSQLGLRSCSVMPVLDGPATITWATGLGSYYQSSGHTTNEEYPDVPSLRFHAVSTADGASGAPFRSGVNVIGVHAGVDTVLNKNVFLPIKYIVARIAQYEGTKFVPEESKQAFKNYDPDQSSFADMEEEVGKKIAGKHGYKVDTKERFKAARGMSNKQKMEEDFKIVSGHKGESNEQTSSVLPAFVGLPKQPDSPPPPPPNAEAPNFTRAPEASGKSPELSRSRASSLETEGSGPTNVMGRPMDKLDRLEQLVIGLQEQVSGLKPKPKTNSKKKQPKSSQKSETTDPPT